MILEAIGAKGGGAKAAQEGLLGTTRRFLGLIRASWVAVAPPPLALMAYRI